MLIEPYNSEWKVHFEAIKGVLIQTISECILTIEHVGSTAVPGMAAKAIIDIDIVFEGEENFLLLREGLENLGYYHNGDQDIPKREVFKRRKDHTHPILDTIRHHLYACPVDSPELKRHLTFRDFLRTHKEAREAYETLKYQIAEEAKQDKKQYAFLKENAARAFVESVLEKADN